MQFRDVVEKGELSKYKDWFHVKEFPLTVKDGRPTYDCFAFEKHMPKLNTENKEVREYLFEVARYWIQDIGVDGWRLDVANEVDHVFWRDFRRVVKNANPDAYILGEIWHDSIMWLQGDQFDSVMNYPFLNAATDFFSKHAIDADRFREVINSLLMAYPIQITHTGFNLLDSHDTARVLTLSNGNKDRLKLVVSFQFTYPGTPCIYYGNEVGMEGGPDPGCRKCMEWDSSKQDMKILNIFQQLIKVRKAYRSLRVGSFKFLFPEPDRGQNDRYTLCYERRLGEEVVVVAMNNSDSTVSASMYIDTGLWKDVLSDGGEKETTFPVEEKLVKRGEVVWGQKANWGISLPPFGVKIIAKIVPHSKS